MKAEKNKKLGKHMTGSHDGIGNHMTNQETMAVTKLQNKRHET